MGSIYSSSNQLMPNEGYSRYKRLVDDVGGDSSSSSPLARQRKQNFIGLFNLGNSCYCNAVLQSLYFCREFHDRVLEYRRLCVENGIRKENLLTALADLYHMIDYSERRVGALTPIRFVGKLRQSSDFFDNFRQQDAHELLSHLLNSISETPIPVQTPTACSNSQKGLSPHCSSVPCPTDESLKAEKSGESEQGSHVFKGMEIDTTEMAREEKEGGRIATRQEGESKDCENMDSKSPKLSTSISESITKVLSSLDHDEEREEENGGEEEMCDEEKAIKVEMEARLNKLRSALKEIADYQSTVCEAFAGKLLSCVTCQQCGGKSNTNEPFFDLSLSIPTQEQLDQMDKALIDRLTATSSNPEGAQSTRLLANGSALPTNNQQSVIATNPYVSYMQWFLSVASERSQSWLRSGWSMLVGMTASFIRDFFSTGSIPLEACLKCFFTLDQLDGEDRYACEKCKKLTSGLKYCQLVKLPNILCIQLKRFRHVGPRHYSGNAKVTTTVKFPIDELDMEPYCCFDEEGTREGASYRLVSFISHFGSSMDYGHYIAYCRSEFDDQWYEYDDSRVTQVNETEVASKEAYVLFYQKIAGCGDKQSVTPVVSSFCEEQGDEPASDEEDEWASAL